MTAWLLLAVGVLLIAGNALFVAAETALVTVERTEVDAAAAAGDARARRLRGALSRLSTQLSAAQLGITVTSLAIGLVAEPSIATLLHGPLEAAGLPEGAVEPVAVALGLLLASVVQMVLGELVPKNLALARPFATATAVLPAQLGSLPPPGRWSPCSTARPTGCCAPGTSCTSASHAVWTTSWRSISEETRASSRGRPRGIRATRARGW